MTRRGITLIELLLAIGLVLILGALVLPAIFTSMRERSFESAAEIVRSQLLLARAHAQVTSRPVEVMYEHRPPRRPGVRARYFVLDAPDAADRDAGAAVRLPVEEDARPDRVIVEGWADRDLPDGFELVERLEQDELPGPAATPASTGEGAAPAVRLAVYLPDGSAPLAPRVWIRDTHGRRGAIEVNPWTGLPSFERIAAEDETGTDEPDAAPEPEPEAPVDEFRTPEPPPPSAGTDAAPEPAPDEGPDEEPEPEP